MTPPIHFDCRYIRVDHHDGISRFSAELFTAVSKITRAVAVISDPSQLNLLPAGTKFVMLHAPTSWQEPFSALKLNRLGVKVLFSPMQTIGSMGRRFKLVLTIHDLIYYRHPAPPPSLSLGVRILWRLFHLTYWPERALLAGCDAVVAVSQTTAALIRKHRLTSKPIGVVLNAPASSDAMTTRPEPVNKSDSRDLVYMGSFMAYKNVECLVAALRHLGQHRLHLLSKITDERRAELSSLAGDASGRIVFHNGVTDAEYREILGSAQALISASKDEGFGIPLVEAMALGIPVIASDIEIFHEIAGDAGLFFDSENPEQLAQAVQQLTDPEIWSTFSKRGKDQAQKFSWDKSARALLEILEPLRK